MLQMATENIIRGITFVNPDEHAVVSSYSPWASEGEPSAKVVEMPTMRAKHHSDKLMVFARDITVNEHIRRVLHHIIDPEGYFEEQIESLGRRIVVSTLDIGVPEK
jgi:hypothetical protein